jgi:hypothetical protein
MQRGIKWLAATLVLAGASAGPLGAGTLYIPLPGVQTVGNAGYEVQVAVTNPGSAPRTVESFQVGSGVDGTARTGSHPSQQTIAPGQTILLEPKPTAGLLELTGANGLAFSARLVGTGPAGSLGVDLPTITSDRAGAAGETLFIQGLRNSATRRADVIVVNLGHEGAKCRGTVSRADGSVVVHAASLEFPPLSHFKFSNVFGQESLDAGRVQITCDTEFFAFAQLHDAATGEFAIAAPAGRGDSAFRPPASTASATCAAATAGTTCFAWPGVVHVSTAEEPALFLFPEVTPGTYGAVHVRLDVKVTGWNQDHKPNAAHGVLWFVRNNNPEMWANLFLRPKGVLGFRHGFFKTHAEKVAIDRAFQAEVGKTYTFDYLYDTRDASITLRVLLDGVEVERIDEVPDLESVVIKTKDTVWVGLSNPGLYKPEPYSRGWVYSDLLVEFF